MHLVRWSHTEATRSLHPLRHLTFARPTSPSFRRLRTLATAAPPRTPPEQLHTSLLEVTMQRRTQPFDLATLGSGWTQQQSDEGRPFAVFGPAIEKSPNDDRSYRCVLVRCPSARSSSPLSGPPASSRSATACERSSSRTPRRTRVGPSLPQCTLQVLTKHLACSGGGPWRPGRPPERPRRLAWPRALLRAQCVFCVPCASEDRATCAPGDRADLSNAPSALPRYREAPRRERVQDVPQPQLGLKQRLHVARRGALDCDSLVARHTR